jgi:hypothetical protein
MHSINKWIICPLVAGLILGSGLAESRGEFAAVSFHGLDRKHILYSFKDLAPDSYTRLNELVLQDPAGQLTVIASWASNPGPEGKYRLLNVMPGNYTLMRLKYPPETSVGPIAFPLGTFPGKGLGIWGTALFDETIDGAGVTNLLVDLVNVPTGVTLTLKNLGSISQPGGEVSGSLLLEKCRPRGFELTGKGTFEATDCDFRYFGEGGGLSLVAHSFQRVILRKCDLNYAQVLGTNGIFEATECTFNEGLIGADLDQMTLQSCGIFGGNMIGTGLPEAQAVGALRIEDCVFLRTGEGQVGTYVAVSRSCRIEKSEFHKFDLWLLSTNVQATFRNNAFFTSALRIPALRHGAALPTIEFNSFWGFDSEVTHGTGDAGFQAISMPDNYWGGPEGPRCATGGYQAGGWLDAMGSYTPLFNGLDPVKRDGDYQVSSVGTWTWADTSGSWLSRPADPVSPVRREYADCPRSG